MQERIFFPAHPPHTICFLNNLYILDSSSTSTIADALTSNRNSTNARKILSTIAKFCSNDSTYMIFDCGVPKSTEGEDDVLPEKMTKLLNANELNRKLNVQRSYGGIHLGPSWETLYTVTSGIATWLCPPFVLPQDTEWIQNSLQTRQHKCRAVVLLGSSTVVMHTIATAYHLRMSRNPSVERSMQYAMGIIRRSGKVLSPKEGIKKGQNGFIRGETKKAER